MKEINLNRLFDEYDLNREDRIILLDIITPIINHPEFKKRIDSNIYPHHHKISLGEHILDDAIVSYKIAKKKLQKNKNINIRLVVLIAMFHDLYELPWQNSQIKKNQVRNRHGFRHPLEAAINAIIWFPEYFEDENDAIILIDGIIHHMYPFPVRSINKNFEEAELNNLEKSSLLPSNLREIIINSSCRNKIFKISFSKSKFKEGRIISKADTKVSFGKEFSFHNLKASVTGKNPNLN